MHKLWCLLTILLSTLALAGEQIPSSARSIKAGHGPAVVKVWQAPGKNGPDTHFYAISMDGVHFATPRATDYQLKLRYAQFDPIEDTEPFIAQPELRGDSKHELFIVQFVTQTLEGYHAAIRDLGGKLSFFLPRHAVLVRMDSTTRTQVEALPFVRWVGAYKPAYRLEGYLSSRIGTGSLPQTNYNIMVTEGLQSTKNQVAERIRLMGGKVGSRNVGKFLIEALLTETQLLRVAGYDEVLFIDRWGPMETDMDNIREIGGGNYVETMAGFTGTGVRGEVIDTGFNLTHMDFASRPLIEHTPVGSDSHGASTSGIVFGDGTADPMGRGMMPDAQGMVASVDFMTGMARYDLTSELVQAPYFAVLQTSSVGSPRTANYTTLSADADARLFDFDVLHCQSQSNAGDTQSRPEAWAKNVLSGGGVNHYNNQDMSDDCWCSSGSTGPATDGRIKPDLSSAYDATFTVTTGSPTAYTANFGGTSGATPIICGHTGLMFEMWSQGVFGNDFDPNATVFENRPHMTTAKALMINSAKQYPFTGINHDLTRVHQGWGHPDIKNLYDLRDRIFVIDETDLLTNTASINYQVSVVAGEPTFAATMIYADPAGNPGAAMHRINDLTLKVTSPSGTIYWGNNGLMEGNWSTPDGTPNEVDTVENVFVMDPEEGSWTITVSADEINQDSHVETPAIDADFALVVSGVYQVGFTMTAQQPSQAVCAPDDATYTFDLMPILGAVDPVTLSVSGVPAGASASFSQNPVVPAGSSDLVITGTENVAPGTYSIAVTGISALVERNFFVSLSISDGAPAAVSLTSPANGSVEVSRSPTLNWGASAGALEYHLQVATDAGFSNLLVDEMLNDNSKMLSNLERLTTHYWRVKAINTCGETTFSPTFNFATVDRAEYHTRLYASGFDLENISIQLVPGGTSHFYLRCSEAITEFPSDPAGGTPLTLADDDSQEVMLSQPISFFGVNYNSLFVGSNGYLTFGAADTDYDETLAEHFGHARLAAIYDDLNPTIQGTVSYKELADRVVVTYENIAEYSSTNSNNFQYEILFDGTLFVNYLGIDLTDAIAGVSDGNGLPSDYEESELTAAGNCSAALPCPGDLNNDGLVDAADYLIAMTGWTTDVIDLNDNGTCDVIDLILIEGLYGACPQ